MFNLNSHFQTPGLPIQVRWEMDFVLLASGGIEKGIGRETADSKQTAFSSVYFLFSYTGGPRLMTISLTTIRMMLKKAIYDQSSYL